jgi:hypothetical protein
MEVVEFDPERAIAVSIHDATMEMRSRVTFDPQGPERTLLTVRTDIPGLDESRAEFLRLVEIAEELTIVGPPVVGATRIVSAAAGPGEIVANVYNGEHLHDEQEGIFRALGMTATRESGTTKEYPRGQEVYVLRFKDASGWSPPSSRGTPTASSRALYSSTD